MKIYFDVCTLCRPFDDQNAMRIRLETDAFNLILQNVQSGNYEMVVSTVHRKEIDAISDASERMELLALLNKYGREISHDVGKTRQRAEELYRLRFGVADAAHLAFAEVSADVFLSCDDKLLKKAAKAKLKVATMNPIEFCVKENLR